MRLLKEGFLKRNLGLGREYLVRRFCEDFGIPVGYIDNNSNINLNYFSLEIAQHNIEKVPKGDNIINIKSGKFCVALYNIDFNKHPIQLFNKSDIQSLELNNCSNIDVFFEKNTFKNLELLIIDSISEVDLDKLPKCSNLWIQNSTLAQPILKYKKLNVTDELMLPLEFFKEMRYARTSQRGAKISIHNKTFYEKFKKWLNIININVKIRWYEWVWNASEIKYDK